MAIRDREVTVSVRVATHQSNGAGMAAYLAAGIGVFAMGLVVTLSEMGLLTLPVLYEPAGGVSSRTTAAVLIWLVSWGALHLRWRDSELNPRMITIGTLLLVLLGLLGTFPPFWEVVA
ncbi:MAG TPA: hypothetical protein VF167_07635 [Longimicrobiaceae bacterium]